MISRFGAATLCMALTILAFAPPSTASETYVATLTGAAAGTPSNATGSATLVLSDDESRIDFTITYTGLSSPEIVSHFHRRNGGILFQLPIGTPKVGTWFSPGATNIAHLRAGDMYVNVHTETYGPGEILGYFTLQTTPVESTTWGRIKSVLRGQ